MFIVILNGTPNTGYADFSQSLKDLAAMLKANGHQIERFDITNMNINYCVGCFNCLVKTPGICIHQDDMRDILQEYVNSDVVIMTSPLVAGSISSILKKTIDRLLPLFLGHLTVNDGLIYHLLRYPRYPSVVLFLEQSTPEDWEYIKIINETSRRMNLNYAFTKLSNEPIKGIANEISNIQRISQKRKK